MELADRFMAAITSGDVDTLRCLYAPGAQSWHNGPGEDSDPLRDLAAAQRGARA